MAEAECICVGAPVAPVVGQENVYKPLHGLSTEGSVQSSPLSPGHQPALGAENPRMLRRKRPVKGRFQKGNE